VGEQGLERQLRPRLGGPAPRLPQRTHIEVCDEAGQLAPAYKVSCCWVSEFQSLPEVDANANAVAIQSMLENEGWEREKLLG
jgi:phage tail-like protein